MPPRWTHVAPRHPPVQPPVHAAMSTRGGAQQRRCSAAAWAAAAALLRRGRRLQLCGGPQRSNGAVLRTLMGATASLCGGDPAALDDGVREEAAGRAEAGRGGAGLGTQREEYADESIRCRRGATTILRMPPSGLEEARCAASRGSSGEASMVAVSCAVGGRLSPRTEAACEPPIDETMRGEAWSWEGGSRSAAAFAKVRSSHAMYLWRGVTGGWD
jgi:hypothetical protein